MRLDFAPAICGVLIFLASLAPARAVDFEYDGFADLRIVAPESERSWLDGGLGKLRYGADNSNFQFAGAVAQGSVLFTPEVSAIAVVRADSSQKYFVLPTEAYLRYRPVSTTPWLWSLKAGAFFPPFSLENTEVGWSSYWTLTPSAINSWFGDELRTIGGEGEVDWRSDEGTLSLTAALFGWNDPAGVMIADRGWAMDDRPTALFDDLRLPDATLILFGRKPPDTTLIFDEIDHRVSWYAGASWKSEDQWHVQLDRYDNEADSAAHDGDYFAWRTNFWSAGASKALGDFTLLAQGLAGTTVITPVPQFSSVTNFNSAYVLLGWERDEWRLAARGDLFRTHTGGNSLLSENGYSLTFAGSWLPKDWLRFTGEVLYIYSTRNEREIVGLTPNQSDVQLQLSARLYL
ncbi:MAG TPA: hypothetical protein VGI20_10530 [Rhizomicrobium sp.]